MEFIKFKGTTAKTALYPKEKILSIDLISSQSMRIRIGTMATKTTAYPALNPSSFPLTSRVHF